MAGPHNSEKMKIHLNSFYGGASLDYKYGIQNAFYYSQGLDFRIRASQMSVLPGSRLFSTNLNDLVTCMVQDPNGIRYATGNKGYIYRVNTSGAVSPLGSLTSNGGTGIVYNQQSDQIYMTGQQTVSMYGQVQSSPSLRLDQFAQSASTDSGVVQLFNPTDNAYDGALRNNAQSINGGITSVNQVSTNASQTYGVPTVLSEGTGNFCFFAPDIEPFYSIAVFIVAPGTGNWTLTLHDSLNNNLGAVTISNGSLKANAYNEFKLPSPGIRALIKSTASGNSATYHFHLTSTAADGTAGVINAGDLSSCDFLLFAYRMVQTNNGWHPAAIFSGLLCIGNGQYLSTYDFTQDKGPNNQQWVRHQLLLDAGYEVCGLSINNQYLVIAAEKRSNNSNHNYQDGKLYFWDGINQQPNFIIDIPMGAPYSVFSMNNVTYFYCAGSLFAWGGGQSVIKVRVMAYQNTDYLNAVDSTIVNPNMMDIRYNLLMLGYPSTTTNVNINYGVWSWGSVELTYPNSFCLSYVLSNGQTNFSAANNLQIGMVRNFVDTMYTSWQYTDASSVTHYGMDIVDNFSTPSPTFNWQSLIYDGGVRYKTKNALRYKINFLPLPAGYTVTPWYIVDRGNKVSGTPATTGDVSIIMELDNARFHELQWGFDGVTTSATLPATFTGITMEVDPLSEEIDMRKDG